MKFEIIINEAGESIPYRKMVQVPYGFVEFEKEHFIVLNNQIEIFNLFEKNEKETIKIYIVGKMLLISFNNCDCYYCLYELAEDYLDSVKKENRVKFIFSNEGLDYYLVFDKING